MKLWLFALALALPASPTWASVEQATSALDQGDFSSAASGYEAAIRDGAVNGHLYYNLGIAYTRLGKTPDAMAAFLAARRFLPRDPDVQANLKATLGSVKDKLEVEMPRGLGRTLAFWIDRTTEKELAYTAGISLGLVSLVLGLCFLVAPLARFRWLVAASYLFPLVVFTSLFVKSGSPEVWGAVANDGAKAYSGPSDKNPAVFELSEGAPVRLGDRVPGGYVRIELSDGKKGWMPEAQVRVF